MDSDKSNPSLAIVGGGITGILMTLSIAHHCPHIRVTLYEAASRFGEIGAGVAFGPNALRCLRHISPEVVEGFEKVNTGNQDADKSSTWFDYVCGTDGPNKDSPNEKKAVKDGKDMGEVSLGGSGKGSVHRAAFLDEMVKLVPESVEVKFKKRLTNMQQLRSTTQCRTSNPGYEGVTLNFADGTDAIHDAVIGCDGIKSRSRVCLLGESDPAAYAVFTGKYCYRGLIPMDEASEALGRRYAANSQFYPGYHGHVLTFPVAKGNTMNVVAFNSADKWESHEWVVHADREKMYKDFSGWGQRVSAILRLMQKPDIWALFNHLPASTYCKGRVCIAGDAAHASTPHQGAGAGMGVEDAWAMSMILKEVHSAKDFENAFIAFDSIRRPRTQKLVSTSREAGYLWDFEDPDIGDDLEKLIYEANERMAWIWNKDIAEDVEVATKSLRDRYINGVGSKV